MNSYIITLDDEKVKEQVRNILTRIFNDELKNRYSSTSDEIAAAVKALIYDHQDDIMNKVVDRAVKELVKKGLPKLLDRFDGGE